MTKALTGYEIIEQNVAILYDQIPFKSAETTLTINEGEQVQFISIWITNEGEIRLNEERGYKCYLEIMSDPMAGKFRIKKIHDYYPQTLNSIIEETINRYNMRYGYIPKTFAEIIQKNLQLMKSNKRGGMNKLINEESMGGNAGAGNVGANFYFDPQGQIIIFENSQDFPDYEKYYSGTFQIELPKYETRIVEEIKAKILQNYSPEKQNAILDEELRKLGSKYKIIDIFFKIEPPHKAKQVIMATAQLYNQENQ